MERNLNINNSKIVLSDAFEKNLEKRWKNRASRTVRSTVNLIKHLERYPNDKQSFEKLHLRYGRLCFYFNEMCYNLPRSDGKDITFPLKEETEELKK